MGLASLVCYDSMFAFDHLVRASDLTGTHDVQQDVVEQRAPAAVGLTSMSPLVFSDSFANRRSGVSAHN